MVPSFVCTFLNRIFLASVSFFLSSREFHKVQILNKSCLRFKEVSERLNPQQTVFSHPQCGIYFSVLVRDIQMDPDPVYNCLYVGTFTSFLRDSLRSQKTVEIKFFLNIFVVARAIWIHTNHYGSGSVT